MAKTRAIRKRIISVRNIHKITGTMERVAQSKVMKLSGRFAHAGDFRRMLAKLLPTVIGVPLDSVQAAQELAAIPLTASAARPDARGGNVLLFCVTSSRGLCGGYNSRVIHAARARMAELAAEGVGTRLAVVGRKGLAYFRFYNIPVLIPVTEADENLAYGRIDGITADIVTRYLAGEFHAVEVISTRFRTKLVQEVRRETLLPFDPGAFTAAAGAAQETAVPPCLTEPAREELRDLLLSMSVKVELFCAVLEAFLSEQAQRAVAMRSASDNALSMIKRLTLLYNRARQAQITSEMIEIISGSEGGRK
jgi:F-type H+-transporting ATPase subunit gamma